MLALCDLEVRQPRSVSATVERMSSTAPEVAIFFLKKPRAATTGLRTLREAKVRALTLLVRASDPEETLTPCGAPILLSISKSSAVRRKCDLCFRFRPYDLARRLGRLTEN